MSFNDDCSRPPIQSTNGNVTLTRVVFRESSTPALHVDEAFSTTAVVVGLGTGALVMDHVTMGFNFSGRAVIWNGSSATIVSSQFYESGGLRLDATSNVVVNSVFREKDRRAVDRIVSTGGPVRVEASTFFWSQPVCDGCLAPNLGFVTGGTGVFDLHSTAIGSGADYPGAQPLLWGNTATGFTSDNLTWVQPTGSQDALAIAAILPNALTAAAGLNPSFIGGDISDITPILSTLSVPGRLIDAIDPGQCPGANELLNPIDASCIATDVFGNARWDVGNNKRNIGAVQNVATPQIAVTQAGDTTVELQWNRPTEPGSGTITGYSIFFRPTGNGPFTQAEVLGAGTLGYTVTDLINGTDYEFSMVAVYTNGVGPESNVVHATPFAPIATPAASGTPGDSVVQLFWTEPTLGGHAGPPSYFVMYRPAGTMQWITGPGRLSARTAMIPELTNGTTYEVGVFAVSTDGTSSLVGSATATPLSAAVPTTPPTTPPTTVPTTLPNGNNTLPGTGSRSLPLIPTAGVLLAAGLSLVVITRRRGSLAVGRTRRD